MRLSGRESSRLLRASLVAALPRQAVARAILSCGSRFAMLRGVRDADRLFAAATAGNHAAFGDLLSAYLPQLHAFVRTRLAPGIEPRESSMDVVQSVCRQLLASPEVGGFNDEEHFRAWLFACALNKVREKVRLHGRARRDVAREETRLERDPLSSVAHLLTPSQAAVGKETAAALGAALAALSEEHREVITLARLAELPHAVIAEVMSRSEPAVRQLLARALLRLRQELRARGVELTPPRSRSGGEV